MKKENKPSVVSGLKESVQKSSAGVVTSYQGIPTPEIVKLRHKLRESNLEMKIVKNTLMRRASEEAGKSFLATHFDNANAVVFGYDDVTAPAKVMTQFISGSGLNMTISGGFLADRWLTATDVSQLATLPSKEELIAKVLGGLQSPIVGLVQSLSSPMLGIVYALSARIKQLEEN